MPLNRRPLVPAWIGALVGLFALSGLPLTFSTGWSLLFGSVVPPTIWLILSGAPRLTLAEAVAEELPPIHRTRTE
jgi:hypothetical protein